MPIQRRSGFTIVELLIVIVVIAILAAISIVAYNGVQNRAKNAQVQADITYVNKKILLYHAENGVYPSTGSTSSVYTDSNCSAIADSDGNKSANWVPGLTGLPQGPGATGAGLGTAGACYAYASDGVEYILSAWNAKRGGPSSDILYRRIGFRELSWFGSNYFYCNHPNIGGSASGSYVSTSDYYKHSYTISNIVCNETPPIGA